MNHRYLLVLLISVATFGCNSSVGRDSDGQAIESFFPVITEDGTKRFTYDIVYIVPLRQSNGSLGSGQGRSRSGAGRSGSRSGAGSGGRGGRGGRGGNTSTNSAQHAIGSDLPDRVEDYIEKVGYCSEGFATTEFEQLDDAHFEVKGQCYDKASEEDRNQFGQTDTDDQFQIRNLPITEPL